MADIVSFSGGKDSTAMLYKMIEKGYNIDEVLNVIITGCEFTENINHIEKVKKDMADKGIKFTILRSKQTFRDLVGKQGWSTVMNRWCTKKLKLDVMRKYLRERYPDEIIFEYIGIAYDEKHRAEKIKKIRARKYYKRYPLIKMRMTEQDALDYCRSLGFDWEGYYNKFSRLNCTICPLQDLSSLRILYSEYPEYWKQLVELEDVVVNSEEKRIVKSFRKNYTIKDLEKKFEKEIAEGTFLSKIKKKFK